MFKELLKCLAKRLSQVQTLGSQKINWITNVDDRGLYIETEQSREKFKVGEKAEPFEILDFDYLEKGFQEFSSKRIATASDFVNTRGRTSFIMAFFAELPFVEVKSSSPVTIAIKEFATDDLPSEQYHRVKVFLEEVLSGRFDPELLSEQAEGNLYRVKTRGRQDARLLGLVDHNNQVNRELFEKYRASTDKDTFLQRLILQHDYFRLALICLDLIRDLSKKDKKRVLEEIGKLIVRNSRGENLMVDSVAKERTYNLLRWLESTQLVDANWSPTEKYFNKDGGADSMDTGLRESLLKIMREYGVAKTEGFAGHSLGTFVRNEVPEEIKKLGVLRQEGYIVTGSVGQGNWAAVPWIAIMNSKITTSTQRGYYIVYLFSEDMERLYLTLAQGVTETTKEEMIRIKAEIRDNISMPERIKKDDEMDMGSGPRARQYALSTAAYIPYTYTDMPSEEILVSDLEDMISVYESYIAFKEEITSSDRKSSQSVLEDQMSLLDSRKLIDHIHSYIKSKGFYFSRDEIINLFLSLKAKPFVILSGISGTGKSKIVQLFAESIGATEDNGQFKLIPVRPDWSDGSDLIGYEDIKGDFKIGPLTEVLMEANLPENLNKPYFILLDEMNLARVEYYFSDILSVMESREKVDDQYISSPVIDRHEVGKLMLRNNVYIIGTVNMDETTYPFSPKVLDRANTIEFNEVHLDNFAFYENIAEVTVATIANEQLAGEFITLKDAFFEHEQLIREITNWLVQLNQILEKVKLHFGYRIRDEVCFYLIYNEKAQLMTKQQAFDLQLHQKILPRISSNDYKIQAVLKELFSFCTNHEWDGNPEYNLLKESRFPKSAEKIADMLIRIEKDGFTSFWG